MERHKQSAYHKVATNYALGLLTEQEFVDMVANVNNRRPTLDELLAPYIVSRVK
jgi:hypothetical protein